LPNQEKSVSLTGRQQKERLETEFREDSDI
jgi:hypothetical protein